MWLYHLHEMAELRWELARPWQFATLMTARCSQYLEVAEKVAARDLRPSAQRPLIFEGQRIAWQEVFPCQPGSAYPVPPEVLGSFATPAEPEPGPIDEIRWTQDELVLPGPGAYALRTNMGPVKILSLPENQPREAQIIELAGFVAKNTVHTTSDVPIVRPLEGHFCPDLAMGTLFRSEQPLKLMCGGVSIVLTYILEVQGFETRVVQLTTQEGLGHTNVEARASSEEDWIFLDADWGHIVLDEQDRPLAIKAIKQRLQTGDMLVIQNIAGRKRWLQRVYSRQELTPPFEWTPLCNGKARDEAEYVQVLRRYTHIIEYLSYDVTPLSERIIAEHQRTQDTLHRLGLEVSTGWRLQRHRQ